MDSFRFSGFLQQAKDLAGNRIIHNVGVTYFGKLGEAGIRFIASLMVTRALGPSKLGILVTLVVMGSVMTSFMVYGLNASATKFLADARKREGANSPSVAKALLMLFGMATGTVTIICVLVTPLLSRLLFKDSQHHWFIYLAILLAIVNACMAVGTAYMRGFERFMALAASNIVGQSIRLAFIVAVVGWGVWNYVQSGGAMVMHLDILENSSLSVLDVLVSNMLAAFIIVLVDIWVLRALLPQLKQVSREAAWQELKQVRVYSSWVFLSTFLGLFFKATSFFFLKIFQTATDVGYYSASLLILKPFEFFPESINTVLLPKASEIKSLSQFHRVLRKVLLAGVVMSLPLLPLVLIPTLIIGALLGDKYLPSVPVLRVLTLNMMFCVIFNPCAILLHRLNVPKVFAWLTTVPAVAGIALNLLLIPRYGPVGAAYATLVSHLVGSTFMLIVLFRIAKSFDWTADAALAAGSGTGLESPPQADENID